MTEEEIKQIRKKLEELERRIQWLEAERYLPRINAVSTRTISSPGLPEVLV